MISKESIVYLTNIVNEDFKFIVGENQLNNNISIPKEEDNSNYITASLELGSKGIYIYEPSYDASGRPWTIILRTGSLGEINYTFI